MGAGWRTEVFGSHVIAELGHQRVWVRTAPRKPQQSVISLWTDIFIVWIYMMLGKFIDIDIYEVFNCTYIHSKTKKKRKL